MSDVSAAIRQEGGLLMESTTTTVDPRVIARALDIDTDDLARMLTRWASDTLPALDYDHAWEPPPLDNFDDAVARARRYLEQAHEAQKAWNADNPPEPED